MPPSRHIGLTDEEDVRLPQIEQAPYSKPKVRLRAQILRLSHRGYNIQATSAYTGRSGASIARDLDRFKERGFEGLLDGRAPGNAPPITEEAGESMEEELPEDGTLNATQLAEALAEDLGVEVTPEAVGRHLLDGLRLEAHPLCAYQTTRPGGGGGGGVEGGVGGPPKGALEGEIVLKYLDESGFHLCLPPTRHTWTLKGAEHQHRVRSRWGSRGRINLIGTRCARKGTYSVWSTP
jgi:transposase